VSRVCHARFPAAGENPGCAGCSLLQNKQAPVWFQIMTFVFNGFDTAAALSGSAFDEPRVFHCITPISASARLFHTLSTATCKAGLDLWGRPFWAAAGLPPASARRPYRPAKVEPGPNPGAAGIDFVALGRRDRSAAAERAQRFSRASRRNCVRKAGHAGDGSKSIKPNSVFLLRNS
jgi:hypothetical protein